MPCFITCKEHLKYIIKQRGIDQPVTWHLARHTFASEASLLNGVPRETISRYSDTPASKQFNLRQNQRHDYQLRYGAPLPKTESDGEVCGEFWVKQILLTRKYLVGCT